MNALIRCGPDLVTRPGPQSCFQAVVWSLVQNQITIELIVDIMFEVQQRSVNICNYVAYGQRTRCATCSQRPRSYFHKCIVVIFS